MDDSQARIGPEDFTRFPTDGELFEFFVEAVLQDKGFMIDTRPARGPDGGRDIVAVQRFTDLLGTEHEERILVQCKHYAHSRKAVSSVGDFRTALSQHQCQRYLLVTSTTATENLQAAFRAHVLDERYPTERADYWTVSDLVGFVNASKRLREQFFPLALIPRGSLEINGAAADSAIRAVADSVGCGVQIVDADCRVLFANTKQQDWFPKVRVGECCHVTYNAPRRAGPCPGCLVREAVSRRAMSGFVTHSPVGPKGTLRSFQVTTAPLHGPDDRVDDRVTAVVEVVSDISTELVERTFDSQLSGLKTLPQVLDAVTTRMGHYFGAERAAWLTWGDDLSFLRLREFSLDHEALRELAARPVYLQPPCAAVSEPIPPEGDVFQSVTRPSRVLQEAPPPFSLLDAGGTNTSLLLEVPPIVAEVPATRLPPWRKLDHFLFAYVGRNGAPQAAVVLGNDAPFKTHEPGVARFCNRMIEKAALAAASMRPSPTQLPRKKKCRRQLPRSQC